MSHLIRIGAGVGAAALAIVLGLAFWPQFDKSLASVKATVEKPVLVASPATTTTAAPVVSAAAATPADGEAMSKLAMALRANAPPTQSASATPSLGMTRGLVLNASATSVASDSARRLCAQGLVALAQGYIASARSYLQAAADAGDARALLALGETYDPKTLARLGARGVKGDLARAREYYSQALAAGVGDARERMAAISSP
jgi:hypothetical protein